MAWNKGAAYVGDRWSSEVSKRTHADGNVNPPKVGSNRGVTMHLSDSEKALVGLATTEDLMQELIIRFEINAVTEDFESSLNFLRAMTLRNILCGMDIEARNYRTVDSS